MCRAGEIPAPTVKVRMTEATKHVFVRPRFYGGVLFDILKEVFMKETAKTLNIIYENLHHRAMKLESELSSGGFDCSWGWENYFGKTDGEIRYYPLPVVAVHGLGNIFLELNSCYLTATYSKTGLGMLELEKLAKIHKYEIFSADDKTLKVYSPEDDISQIRTKLFITPGDYFCICVHMPSEQDFNSVREVLAEFRVPEDMIENHV